MKLITVSLAIVLMATAANAAVIAQWTFETSIPDVPSPGANTAGPYAPEVGSGAALGSHANAGTIWSNPSGNGSNESFSSDKWAVGDFYQFSTSTVGYSGIQIEWDQGSSNTGPRDFAVQYSTNGATFTQFGAQYIVLANASPNPTWNVTTYNAIYHFAVDLSSVTALNNKATVYFRLVDMSTVSANGGTVATAGTDRVDNFTIAGVPEPMTMALLGLGSLVMLRRRK